MEEDRVVIIDIPYEMHRREKDYRLSEYNKFAISKKSFSFNLIQKNNTTVQTLNVSKGYKIYCTNNLVEVQEDGENIFYKRIVVNSSNIFNNYWESIYI